MRSVWSPRRPTTIVCCYRGGSPTRTARRPSSRIRRSGWCSQGTSAARRAREIWTTRACGSSTICLPSRSGASRCLCAASAASITTRRLDVPAAERDRTITTVEYSDGFGRLLQTRTQAEDVLFGDPTFGGGVLAVDPAGPDVPAAGRIVPNPVAVSGWQTYDNKGRVVEKYEPFFAQGWDYRAPEGSSSAKRSSCSTTRAGQLVRSRNPGRIRTARRLRRASQTSPILDVRAHTVGDLHVRCQRQCGAHARDGRCRVRESLEHAGEHRRRRARPDRQRDCAQRRAILRATGTRPAPRTISRATSSRSPMRWGARPSATSTICAKRRWRVDSIDAGRSDTVPDVLGNPTEVRDGKGARTLCALRRAPPTAARCGHATMPPARSRCGTCSSMATAAPRRSRPPTAAPRAKRNCSGRSRASTTKRALSPSTPATSRATLIDKSRRVIADAPIRRRIRECSRRSWNIPMFRSTGSLLTAARSVMSRRACSIRPRTERAPATTPRPHEADALAADVEGQRRALRPTYNRGGGLEQLLLDDTVYVERIAYDARGQRTLIALRQRAHHALRLRPEDVPPRAAAHGAIHQVRCRRRTRLQARRPGLDVRYDLAGNILTIDRARARLRHSEQS